MRQLALSIFIGITLSSFSQSEIDFKNKVISKEICNTFLIESYHEMEFASSQTLINNRLNGKLNVLINNNKNIGFSYVGRVNSCRAGGCSVEHESNPNQTSEYFDYLILFDSIGIVQQVKVFNYQATHGQEICSKGWLKQFEGYQGKNNLRVGKEVDAISGATISVYGITGNINIVSTLMTSLLLAKK